MAAHLIEPNDVPGLDGFDDPRDLYWRGWHDAVRATLDALNQAGHVDEIAGISPLDDDCRALRRQAGGTW